jgi:oxygen-independent coproporphyrinogen-3 oxidase
MLLRGFELLTSEGYQAIGMDHFALPEDDLAKAFREGKLHRNFQGYCSHEHNAQVYAFGATGISQLHRSYFQNQKDTRSYTESIEKGELPVAKGYILNEEEQRVREVISRLMCNGELDFPALAKNLDIPLQELKEKLRYHPARFEAMEKDGLLTATDDHLRVSPLGMLLVRVIAQAFDPAFVDYKKPFSRII